MCSLLINPCIITEDIAITELIACTYSIQENNVVVYHGHQNKKASIFTDVHTCTVARTNASLMATKLHIVHLHNCNPSREKLHIIRLK